MYLSYYLCIFMVVIVNVNIIFVVFYMIIIISRKTHSIELLILPLYKESCPCGLSAKPAGGAAPHLQVFYHF